MGDINMSYRFSKSSMWFDSDMLKKVLSAAQGKDIISFAGGLPAEEYFPIDAVKAAVLKVIDQGKATLQYGVAEGFKPLREALCERMAVKGMHATSEEILITTGSQQVIDLVSRIFINPGDVILVESPSFFGAMPVFQSQGATIISVSGEKDGMDMKDLQRKIDKFNPKFVYVVPTFSNPTGRTWSVEKRKDLLAICKKSGVPILEDDPYGELQFNKSVRYPTLFSLNNNGQAKGNCVVYTSSFSKIVAPALRTGWAIGDKEIIEKMISTKRISDTHSSSLDQQTLYHLVMNFDLENHISTISHHYGNRMQMMAKLLKEHAWSDANWNEPEGGMFFWVELAKDIDTNELLTYAQETGVAFVPGAYFYAQDPEHNMLRMNFTHSNEEAMVQGLAHLKHAIDLYYEANPVKV